MKKYLMFGALCMVAMGVTGIAKAPIVKLKIATGSGPLSSSTTIHNSKGLTASMNLSFDTIKIYSSQATISNANNSFVGSCTFYPKGISNLALSLSDPAFSMVQVCNSTTCQSFATFLKNMKGTNSSSYYIRLAPQTDVAARPATPTQPNAKAQPATTAAPVTATTSNTPSAPTSTAILADIASNMTFCFQRINNQFIYDFTKSLGSNIASLITSVCSAPTVAYYSSALTTASNFKLVPTNSATYNALLQIQSAASIFTALGLTYDTTHLPSYNITGFLILPNGCSVDTTIGLNGWFGAMLNNQQVANYGLVPFTTYMQNSANPPFTLPTNLSWINTPDSNNQTLLDIANTNSLTAWVPVLIAAGAQTYAQLNPPVTVNYATPDKTYAVKFNP